jgi:hypothetical protein
MRDPGNIGNMYVDSLKYPVVYGEILHYIGSEKKKLFVQVRAHYRVAAELVFG